MISILIVGEVDLVRGALAAVLAHEDDLNIASALPLGQDVVDAARLHSPAVVIIYLDHGKADGIELAHQLVTDVPECRVLVLTSTQTAPVVRRALAAGVWGLVGPDTPPDHLVHLIRRVAGGERIFDPLLVITALRYTDNPLTDRERAVLALASEGLRSPEIARRLFLSPGTVRNYLSAARRKTGARTRLEAVRRAREEGWL